VLRWKNDLTRTVGQAGGDRGRDPSNYGGWYAPNGSKVNKCFTQVYMKSNNNDIIKQFPVEEYVTCPLSLARPLPVTYRAFV